LFNPLDSPPVPSAALLPVRSSSRRLDHVITQRHPVTSFFNFVQDRKTNKQTNKQTKSWER
jgi:hypothetical protein